MEDVKFDEARLEKKPLRKVRRHLWHKIPHALRPTFEEFERKQMWRSNEET